MRVAVTGATGFIGRSLCATLVEKEFDVVAVTRGAKPASRGITAANVGSLDDSESLIRAFTGAESVAHLAARVHVMKETAGDGLAEFRRVNVAGSLSVARAAIRAGVRRFVFLSSIKVNGESSPRGVPVTAWSEPVPCDPYGVSKHEAEIALKELGAAEGLEIVIVRPVLVYGPGVKGNFRALMRWVDKRIPLPLAAVDNRRSLVGIDNLSDLLVTCLQSERAAGKTFLVSDGEDVSTSQLIRRLARAMRRSPMLFPVPVSLLNAGARIAGKADEAQRLLGSLQVDITDTMRTLEWKPPYTMNYTLGRTVSSFLAP